MDSKKLALNFAFFISVVIILFGLLVLMIFATRNTWDKRLQKRVVQTIDRLYPGEYVAGDKVSLQGPYSTSIAAYELIPVSNQSQDSVYGVIIRIASLYGPLPAVYKYSTATGSEFIGFSVFDSHVGKEAAITESLRNSVQVLRWKKRIPKLLGVENSYE